MATVDELREHVLDDAIELMETVGIVTPLATTANVIAPAQLLLRRLLTRHAILVLTRLHAKAENGRTGVTASIESVLEAAAQHLSASQIDALKARRSTLLKDLEAEGITYKDLYNYRTTELAHSVHAPNNQFRGGWYAVHALADGTYQLVKDIEDALVKTGASGKRSLPTDKYDEWVEHGRALWKCNAA